jgi:ParB family chromosome partitioning protein
MSEADNRLEGKGLRRPALGRGLAALIPSAPAPSRDGVQTIAIERITPERGQPRQHFDRPALEELAASIRQKGILQPILVRRNGADYRLVAGERRWRAAQLAGLHEVPALVRDLSDGDVFEIALIENLQREDLDPIEEALAYQRLIEERGLTQEQAADRVGRDRSTVANALRLLKLPEALRDALAAGTLSPGHGRALLVVGSEERLLKLAQLVIARQLSVRATERLARAQKSLRPAADRGGSNISPNLVKVREDLRRALGVKVALRARGGRGTIEVPFRSLDEFDRILRVMLHR